MKVLIKPYILSCKFSNKTENRISYPNIARLREDTVNFGSANALKVKKEDFKGFDLACINILKPPIEKFNSKDDFYKWVNKELNNAMNLDQYLGFDRYATGGIRYNLGEWKKHLEYKKNYKSNPALSLIIFKSLPKETGPESKRLPPVLDPKVLQDTIESVEKKLNENKNTRFDFNKMYQENLRIKYLKKLKKEEKIPTSDKTGFWIKIPSQKNDRKNFKNNLLKLRALSYKTWCTRAHNAQDYLTEGDFHILFVNNRPKAIIKFKDDKIAEIQGEKNDKRIPPEYLDEINSYVTDNGFNDPESLINSEIKTREGIAKFHKQYEKLIKAKDYSTLLNYFDISCKTLDNGNLEISHFQKPYNEMDILELGLSPFHFKEVGIDENDLFQHVEGIEYDCILENTDVTNLGKLKFIGRFADFTNSKIKDLGQLRSIGRDAFFSNSHIENLGNLEKIGGSVSFTKTKVKNLGQLKTIGKNADFGNSQIKDLGQLERIGGNADFSSCKIKNLGKLKYIGGDLIIDKDSNLDYSKIDIRGDVKFV